MQLTGWAHRVSKLIQSMLLLRAGSLVYDVVAYGLAAGSATHYVVAHAVGGKFRNISSCIWPGKGVVMLMNEFPVPWGRGVLYIS